MPLLCHGASPCRPTMLDRASTSINSTAQGAASDCSGAAVCIGPGKQWLTFPPSSISSASVPGQPVSGLAQPLLAVRRRAPPLRAWPLSSASWLPPAPPWPPLPCVRAPPAAVPPPQAVRESAGLDPRASGRQTSGPPPPQPLVVLTTLACAASALLLLLLVVLELGSCLPRDPSDHMRSVRRHPQRRSRPHPSRPDGRRGAVRRQPAPPLQILNSSQCLLTIKARL